MLCLILMLAWEPILHYRGSGNIKLLHPHCTEAKDIKDDYSTSRRSPCCCISCCSTTLLSSPGASQNSFGVCSGAPEVGPFLRALVYVILASIWISPHSLQAVQERRVFGCGVGATSMRIGFQGSHLKSRSRPHDKVVY